MNRTENDTVDIRGEGKSFADVFYTSAAWRRCRKSYLNSIGGLCQECKRRKLIVPADEVHHIIKLTPENINRPEIALNWKNLRALCEECHKNAHRKQKRWKVDDEGNVTLLDPP